MIRSLRAPGRLIKGDLLASLAEMEDSFDIILASFSLHHLADPADKRRTLKAVVLVGEFGKGTNDRKSNEEKMIMVKKIISKFGLAASIMAGPVCRTPCPVMVLHFVSIPGWAVRDVEGY